MANPNRISDTIRQQTGMSLRELAEIWQVSPATLTLSLQGKRPRPAGLTECLAVQGSAQAATPGESGSAVASETFPSLAREASRMLRRLRLQYEALLLQLETAQQTLDMLHTRCGWLPVLLEQPTIQADGTKKLAVQLALRKAIEQRDRLGLRQATLNAQLKGLEAMMAAWANL
jgi:DNA-binding MarR family transcriptional regulator